ncbi:hypothetical protein [Tabrizicola caldifontis]|uniref:hypothetical protein n=1 Tax=Tabrizicola caldifontis TaxID=2528036 RepID=UPI001080BEC9|nr:hypothetical protein [Rhodobacter sp. YIM 73028]
MARKRFGLVAVAAIAALSGMPVLASEDRSSRPSVQFDWFANAARPISNAEAIARTRAAIIKARGLARGASWVCSPAGSGKKATCYRG